MHALNYILDYTTHTSLDIIAAAREDIADYTATGELDHPMRDTYLEHLDMLETAARITFILI